MTQMTALAAFLATSPCAGWTVAALPGDASSRRYHRLSGPDGASAIVMDAGQNAAEELRVFVDIAARLRQQGASAPEVLAQDLPQGFLLLEDLGDGLFSTLMSEDPARETPLYEAAVDLLLHLHSRPETGTSAETGLAPLTPAVLSEMTGLAFDHYRQAILGDAATAERHAFETRFEQILAEALTGEMVFVHRDFHAQNLLWLPERADVRRVGVIDFQDARAGHAAYDLVSMLQDARRDVPAEVETAMIHRYIAKSKADREAFQTAYVVLGVQRNMRILGIFARLSLVMGKQGYLPLIPRVWGHFIRGLAHPALAPVADDLRALMPAPTPEALKKLEPVQ